MNLMWDAHFYYFKECVVVRFSDKRAWEKKKFNVTHPQRITTRTQL